MDFGQTTRSFVRLWVKVFFEELLGFGGDQFEKFGHSFDGDVAGVPTEVAAVTGVVQSSLLPWKTSCKANEDHDAELPDVVGGGGPENVILNKEMRKLGKFYVNTSRLNKDGNVFY